MAKYIIGSNGNQTVNCELLNENAGRYIVRFKSGVIKDVDKNKVTSLDKIDESVLELVNEGKLSNIVKGAASEFGKFGKKIGSAIKGAVDYVISRIIKAKNRIWFQQENGEIARAIHPVNGMLAAAENDAIGFIPSEDMVNFADDLGVTARSFEPKVSDYAYAGSAIYCDHEFDKNGNPMRLNESQENVKQGTVYGSEKEDVLVLTNEKFVDVNTEILCRILHLDYRARVKGQVDREWPLFIWGAPGIGKTSIIKAVAAEHGNVPVLTVMASNIEPEAFTMPAQVSREYRNKRQKEIFKSAISKGTEEMNGAVGALGDKIIKDLPKSWMPVYEFDNSISKEELDQRIYLANGAIPNDDGLCDSDGPGGFFFIDEFVRMSDAGMASIFDMPLSRQIGSNSDLRLGTKWVVVCASNRYSDITRKGTGSLRLIGFDAAATGRFKMCNFVPKYEEWKDWALGKADSMPNFSKVNKNFIEFIDANPDAYYALARQDMSRPQDLDCTLVQACPRRWEQLSQAIRIILDDLIDSGKITVIQGKHHDDYIFDALSDEVVSSAIYMGLGTKLAEKLIDYLTMKMNGLSFTDLKEMIEKGDAYVPRQEVADKFTTAFYTSKQAIEEYFSNVSLNSALQNLLNGFGDYIPTDGLAKLIYAFGKLIDKTKGNQQGGDKAQTFLDCLTQRCGYAKPSEVKTADEEKHLVRTAIAKVFGVATAQNWLG